MQAEEPVEEGAAENIIELVDGRMLAAEMVLWTAGQAPVVPKSEAGTPAAQWRHPQGHYRSRTVRNRKRAGG